jgi:thiamine biosynthesis lipoprotein
MPDAAAVDRARELVGWRNVVLDESRQTAQLLRPGMQLDLGGIGKGYAAQSAADLLRQRGCPRCLVAVAGDIVAGDPPQDASGWTVAVSTGAGPQAREAIELSNCAISTSGDAEQTLAAGGQRHSHIIDPNSPGNFGLSGAATASVIAPDGMTADALATTLVIIGPERGLAIAESLPGVYACIIQRDGTLIGSYFSGAFPRSHRAAP